MVGGYGSAEQTKEEMNYLIKSNTSKKSKRNKMSTKKERLEEEIFDILEDFDEKCEGCGHKRSEHWKAALCDLKCGCIGFRGKLQRVEEVLSRSFKPKPKDI